MPHTIRLGPVFVHNLYTLNNIILLNFAMQNCMGKYLFEHNLYTLYNIMFNLLNFAMQNWVGIYMCTNIIYNFLICVLVYKWHKILIFDNISKQK